MTKRSAVCRSTLLFSNGSSHHECTYLFVCPAVGLSIILVYFMTPTELRRIVRWESRTSNEFTHSSVGQFKTIKRPVHCARHIPNQAVLLPGGVRAVRTDWLIDYQCVLQAFELDLHYNFHSHYHITPVSVFGAWLHCWLLINNSSRHNSQVRVSDHDSFITYYTTY